MNEIKLFDLHSDLPTRESPLEENVALALKYKNQKNYVINAVYKGNRSLQTALKIARALKENSLPLAFEDCCYEDYLNSQNIVGQESLAEELASKLCEYNPLYISLGWNYDNLFCGGCAGGGGLTALGKKVVQVLNRKSCAVDCAHSNEKTFYALAQLSNKFLCSHTAFNWIFPHRRNLTKEQVKTIIGKGGIIGLIGVGHFLSGNKGRRAHEQAFFAHLYDYIENFGAQGLAIGSDFYGSNAPFYTDGDYSFSQKINEELTKKGVSQKMIDKILYKNAVDFFGFNTKNE